MVNNDMLKRVVPGRYGATWQRGPLWTGIDQNRRLTVLVERSRRFSYAATYLANDIQRHTCWARCY